MQPMSCLPKKCTFCLSMCQAKLCSVWSILWFVVHKASHYAANIPPCHVRPLNHCVLHTSLHCIKYLQHAYFTNISILDIFTTYISNIILLCATQIIYPTDCIFYNKKYQTQPLCATQYTIHSTASNIYNMHFSQTFVFQISKKTYFSHNFIECNIGNLTDRIYSLQQKISKLNHCVLHTSFHCIKYIPHANFTNFCILVSTTYILHVDLLCATQTIYPTEYILYNKTISNSTIVCFPKTLQK